MNSVIEKLEFIGQNSSLQQYENLKEMLSELNINEKSIINLNHKEFVCMLVPDDDDDSNDPDDSDDNQTE